MSQTLLRTIAELDRYTLMLRAALSKAPQEVTHGDYKPKRSEPQNNYLFGVCYPMLCKHMGYEVEETHEWMCGHHFGWVDRKCPKTPLNPDGMESKPFRTTTKDENGKRVVMLIPAFMDFVAMVQRIAAKAGVFIPDPDPMYFVKKEAA